jgi:hypothetical protein
MSKSPLIGNDGIDKDLKPKAEEVKPPVCKVLCSYLCNEKARIFGGLFFLLLSGLDSIVFPLFLGMSINSMVIGDYGAVYW